MLSFLKDHPFNIEAFFDDSLVLTYAVAREELQSLIPGCLALDTLDDKWAFIAVAFVNTRALRPAGLPPFMGNDFRLIGYRIFVRYTTNEGKRLRGLFIIKSETDNRKMTFLGNIFSHYRYNTTDVQFRHTASITEVLSIRSGINISFDNSAGEIRLPVGSPFLSWKEARRFAGPLPFTFSYNSGSGEVLIIEGVRTQWQPQPVSVLQCNVSFVKEMGCKSTVLASAFILQNIPYYWKKGRKEIWNRK